VDAVTGTVTVQEPPAGIELPVKFTLVPPELAASVPLQVVLPVPEIVTPVGSASVNDAPVAAAESELLKVMVSVETPSSAIVAGLNALLTVGGIGLAGGGTAHAATVTVLESIVTAAVCAKVLPATLASVVRVMLAYAKILPTKVEPVPSVAELPTCQKTLHC
jgi:hypothetical protein